MEDNKEILELLQKIEAHNRRQALMSALLCLLALAAAICCGVTFALIFKLLPQIEAVIPQVETVLAQMQAVLGNLELTTENLNTIDFDTLNTAIENLATVVEPLSKFANMFR